MKANRKNTEPKSTTKSKTEPIASLAYSFCKKENNVGEECSKQPLYEMLVKNEFELLNSKDEAMRSVAEWSSKSESKCISSFATGVHTFVRKAAIFSGRLLKFRMV
ncbi:hypothetical protein L1887_23578 [Cichorium endivia]|nr:hypothetical protein L1887_23578 [Cichorium endivia]